MDAGRLKTELERLFSRIHQERMQGIPILNEQLEVEAVGFQPYGEGFLGVMITPWFMNLMLVAQNREESSLPALGEQQVRAFPSKEYTFTVNDLEELGLCLTHALYSPMSKFPDQATAVQTAEAFLTTLMDESLEQSDSVDEARMARYLKGDEMEQIRLEEEAEQLAQEVESNKDQPQRLSRRDLIRGAFLNG